MRLVEAVSVTGDWMISIIKEGDNETAMNTRITRKQIYLD
jgi:hypothetical protein